MKFKLVFLLSLLAAACAGCVATKSLISAANSPAREQLSGSVRLLSAAREGDRAYLCFERTRSDAQTEQYALRVPTAATENFIIQDSLDRPAVLKPASDAVVRGQCQSLDTPIPIVEVTPQKPLRLQANIQDAIYVQYEGNRLQSLGYLSTQPLAEHRHPDKARYGYAIDLSQTNVLYSADKKRSHLLLLLPASMAADALIDTAAIVVWFSVGVLESCAKTAGGCKGGS
jgi:hypothetical protein